MKNYSLCIVIIFYSLFFNKLWSQVHINEQQNVGIKEVDPQVELDVNGRVKIRQMGGQAVSGLALDIDNVVSIFPLGERRICLNTAIQNLGTVFSNLLYPQVAEIQNWANSIPSSEQINGTILTYYIETSGNCDNPDYVWTLNIDQGSNRVTVIERRDFQSNILYVDPSGNNASAIKGYKTHPYRDPWHAIIDAQPNDVVFVFPGTYSMGGPGSGSDFEQTYTGNQPYVSLIKQKVKTILSDGVKIMVSGTNIALWGPDDDPDYYLGGNGEIEIQNSGYSEILIQRRQPTQIYGQMYVKLKKILGNGNKYSCAVFETIKKLHLEIDEVVMGGQTTQGFLYLGPYTINPQNSIESGNIVINIGSLTHKLDANVVLPTHDKNHTHIVKMSGFNNSVISIKINNAIFVHKTEGLINFPLYAKGMKNTYVNIDIGNLDFKDYRIERGTFSAFNYTDFSILNDPQTLDPRNGNYLYWIYSTNTVSDKVFLNVNIGNITGHITSSGNMQKGNLLSTTRFLVNVSVGSHISLNRHPIIHFDRDNYLNESQAYISIKNAYLANGVNHGGAAITYSPQNNDNNSTINNVFIHNSNFYIEGGEFFRKTTTFDKNLGVIFREVFIENTSNNSLFYNFNNPMNFNGILSGNYSRGGTIPSNITFSPNTISIF